MFHQSIISNYKRQNTNCMSNKHKESVMHSINCKCIAQIKFVSLSFPLTEYSRHLTKNEGEREGENRKVNTIMLHGPRNRLLNAWCEMLRKKLRMQNEFQVGEKLQKIIFLNLNLKKIWKLWFFGHFYKNLNHFARNYCNFLLRFPPVIK